MILERKKTRSTPSRRFSVLRVGKTIAYPALIHFNYRVKSLVLHVINPLAVMVDIALGRTLGRGRAPAVAEGPHSIVYASIRNPDAESAEDDSLIVPVPPVPRCNECALP